MAPEQEPQAPTEVKADPVSALPDGGTPVVETGPIRKWNDKRMDLSPRRKKVLAVIQDLFPMAFYAEGDAGAPWGRENTRVWRPFGPRRSRSRGQLPAPT